MTLRSRKAATEALEDALRNVDADNPVAASRKLARVARQYRPETRAEWDAFRWTAVKALRPYFEARDMDPAKATAWAVVDAHHGQTRGGGSDNSDKVDNGRNSRALRVRQALTGGGGR